jgi:hypothetical protein
MYCKALLNGAERIVPEAERAEVEELHRQVFTMFRSFAGGYGSAAAVALLMAAVSFVGLGLEIRTKRYNKQTEAP